MPKKKSNLALVPELSGWSTDSNAAPIPPGAGMTDQDLEAIVNARQGANAIIKELQAEVDLHSDRIKEELALRGVKKLTVGNWIPQVVDTSRTTLNKAKLLSAGVTVAQIEAASERTEIVSLRVLPVPMEK